jgi:thermitase
MNSPGSARILRRKLALGALALTLLALTAILIVAGRPQGWLALSRAQADAHSQPRYVPGVVLVGFRPGVSAEHRQMLERAVGARGVRAFGVTAERSAASRRVQARLGSSFVLHVGRGRELSTVAWLRARRPWVRYAEPDYIMTASGATNVPNDRSFSLQWGSLNTGQSVNGTAGMAGADDGAARAWAHSTGSRLIVIGEVDTGIDYNHPDLAANVWSNPGGVGGCPAGTHGYNVVAGTCDPMDDDTYYGGHGTHVAGIMGAVGNNGTGVAGMNWRTTLLPVKWLSNPYASGSTTQLISALNWLLAAKQAGVNIRVINDSATFVGDVYSQPLSDEIDVLGANGILFVTAAGNSGSNNDDPAKTRYPCGYRRPNEICVTASNQNDARPRWANYGRHTVDLAAPGNNIYSTLRNGTYGYINGSSMASAQVSGAAALILSVQDMTVTALKARILTHVDPLPALSGRVRTGGRLDVCKAMPGCTPLTGELSLPSRAVAFRGRVRLTVRCGPSAPCSGTLTLFRIVSVRVHRHRRTRRSVVAGTSYSLAAGGRRTISVKLTDTFRRLLSRRHDVRLQESAGRSGDRQTLLVRRR